MTEPDRRLERYRSWPLEAAVFAVVIATFAGTALWLPEVREAFRARGWGEVPVAFVAAPAFQVVVVLAVVLAARWVVRTSRPFTQGWRTQRVLQELRRSVEETVAGGAEIVDEAALSIEERARRAIVRFLTFLALLIALQLAFIQFIILSLASNRNPSRPGVLIIAVFSALLVVFVLVQMLRGWRRRRV
jgi:hypothetical protein